MSSFDAIKNLFEERRGFARRVTAIAILALLLLAMLVARLVELQVWEHGYYVTRSTSNRTRVAPIPPVRGLIYGRYGTILAKNRPAFNLVITPDRTRNLHRTLNRLGKILPITETDIERFRERARQTPGYRAIPLLTNLTPRQVARFEVERYQYSGVGIQAGLAREYPMGPLTSHLIGYVNGITGSDLTHIDPAQYAGLDQIGRTGIERSFENVLRGTPGAKLVEVNAAGRPLHTLNEQPAKSGDDLYLTIDARLQAIAYQALGKLNGAVVAIDPQNGAILAMVSKPGYNPSLFVNGLTESQYKNLLNNPNRPLYNRAIQGTFAPGSTIKPFISYAALQAGIIDGSTHFYCPGYFTLPGSKRVFHGWKRGGHGWVDLVQALEESCDIFFYHVAINLGIERIDDYLKRFGFGEDTGVKLPNENPGLLPSPAWKRQTYHQSWYPGQTLNIGIGQGYWRVTPMQLAQATARIAMRGGGFAPHLLYAYEDLRTGHTVKFNPRPLPPIPVHNSDEWNLIIEGMEAVTQKVHGTAYAVGHNAPYRIAAKTGTAQVVDLSQKRKAFKKYGVIPMRLRDNALFIAFAPVNHPRIAVAVVAEHGAHGGFAAAPVARKVMDEYLLGKVVYHAKTGLTSDNRPHRSTTDRSGQRGHHP